MRQKVLVSAAAAVLAAVVGPSLAMAQTPPPPQTTQAPAEPAHDVNDLAKQTQNPVSNLISVPLQFNFNTGGDLQARTMFNFNLQPVIPFKATQNWNLILRPIIPINSIPVDEDLRASGVGDIQVELFLSPAKSGRLIWGVGPAFSFPTATMTPAETGTWAFGPTAVALSMEGPWVLGALVSQLWPVADAGGNPKTDLFTLQPFVNYNFGHGWALSFSPILTANWNASSGNQWTVPLGLGVTKTTVFNHRPMNIGVQYYYNVVRPDGSAGEQLKFIISLLFPR